MSDDLEDLKRRLVLRHKPGGRCVYDRTAKVEFVEMCLRPGISVSRLAREFGINSNQVSRWVREHGQGRKRAGVARASAPASPFVAVPLLRAAPVEQVISEVGDSRGTNLQARLPNGVTLELRCADPRLVGVLVEALGRLGCSDSTRI